MKGTITILFFFCLTACSYRQPKITLDNQGGKEILTYESSSDTLTYLYEYYYPTGSIQAKGNYINGKQEGLWEWWYENGNKQNEAFFENGLYFKKRTHWYDDGKLLKEEFIENPCSDNCCLGKVIFYNKDGTISQIKYNDPGSVSAIVYRYYPNGKLSEEHHAILVGDSAVEHGKLVQYFDNGKVEVVGFLNYGCKDSVWRWNDSLGNLSQVDTWENCRLKERREISSR